MPRVFTPPAGGETKRYLSQAEVARLLGEQPATVAEMRRVHPPGHPHADGSRCPGFPPPDAQTGEPGTHGSSPGWLPERVPEIRAFLRAARAAVPAWQEAARRRLSDADKAAIRQAWQHRAQTGDTRVSLAARYGVHPATITKITRD